MQSQSIEKILEELDAKNHYLFNYGFYTGKLGYATTLIIIGNIYNDSLYYNKGGKLLLDILEKSSSQITTDNERLILCYVLNFLEQKGLVEIGSSVRENLFVELLKDRETDIFNYVNNAYYVFLLYLDLDRDFKHAILNELFVRSCSLIESKKENLFSEANLNFLFFLDLSIKSDVIDDKLYLMILRKKVEEMKSLFIKRFKITDYQKSDSLMLLKLYSLMLLTKKDFLREYRACCNDFSLSQRITYHIFFSEVNMPFISNDKDIILKNKNMGIVNGKLALFYLDKKFVKENEIGGLSLILLFFNQ